jgi:DNA-binding response OmpR family regulator
MNSPIRILCVEDTPELREDLVLELQDANYEVIEAANGNDALAALERHNPDLVLCDIQLPDMDGISVLAAIRAGALPDVPVIMVSAFSDASIRNRAAEFGIARFMVKPVDYDDLLTCISTIFETAPTLRA